ncbi:hypothetical protein D3C86_1832420 [compost metagenome]
MADGNQCLARLAFGIGGLDQPLMHLADATQVVIAQVGPGDFGGPQERQRQAPAGDGARGVGQWNQQAFSVQLPVIQPQNPAQRVRAQAPHQRRGQLDARA